MPRSSRWVEQWLVMAVAALGGAVAVASVGVARWSAAAWNLGTVALWASGAAIAADLVRRQRAVPGPLRAVLGIVVIFLMILLLGTVKMLLDLHLGRQ